MATDLNILKTQDTDDNLNPFKVKVFVRGVQIKNSNIMNLIIKESVFNILPTIELTWNDYGIFSDVFPLGDNDEISVEISTHRELDGIKAVFTISDYNIVPVNIETHSNYYIFVTGILKNKSMLQISMKSFSRSTSSNVLSDIFKSEGYKVIKSVDTKDTMTWLQSFTPHEMIQNVLDYSYVGDNNMLFAFVDKNGNSYIVDLDTIIKSPKKYNIKLSTDPMSFYYKQIEPTVGVRGELKNLGYNYFRFSFHPGFNNKTGGYGVKCFAYDYDNPTVYSSEIKGAFKPLTEYSLKHKDMKNSTQFEYMSMKYKNSNVHENYHKAYIQNEYIKKSFFSDVLILNTYFNNEVKLLDKMSVEINSLAHSGANKPEFNKIYSGDYVVVGIINQISQDGTYKSQLYLSRGGINKSAFTENTEMKLK